MTDSNLMEEYKRAVSGLMRASEAIDESKGVKQRDAKLDFVMAQNNLLSVQMMMIMEMLNKEVPENGDGEDN